MARQSSSASKISVWWDIENCHVPRNVDPHYIAQNLKLALHHANLNGPITVDLFGDTRNLDHKTLEALSSTGITINHIPRGNKDAADKAILVGMLFWALDNSPPAHFLLISGDGDFANALHRLRLKGYDILLARPDQAVKPALLGAATSIWYWTDVAKGQILGPEEPKQSCEESYGRFPPSTVRNDEFLNVNLSRQRSLPEVSGQHSTFLSGASGMSKDDEGIQSGNRKIAPSQESDGRNITSSKVSNPQPHHHRSQRNNLSVDEREILNNKKDTSVAGSAHDWVSDWNTNSSIPCEDTRWLNEDSFKLEPKFQADEDWKRKWVSHAPASSSAKKAEFLSSKHVGNLGHQPLRLGEMTPGDKQGIPLGSSNKISDHTKALATTLPMSTVIDHTPCLSQDAIRAYSSSMSKVMNTFEILKLDGLLPTQGHLQDCLCYWDKQRGKVNLKKILDQAVNWQHIVKVLAGERAFTYFLPLNTQLWKCYNIYGTIYAFSDDLWNEFHQFLCCSKNWQFFVHSQSMYEAAQRLKGKGHGGIRDLAVGEIILFLNQAIQKRSWLNLEVTPTFVLSIKSQVIMEQNPPERSKSSTLRVAKEDEGFVAKGSVEVSSLYEMSAQLLIFEKLRAWLLETSQTIPNYDVSLVPKDFYSATGIHLDVPKLGFAKLHDLIEEFGDVVTIKIARKGRKILCPAAKVNTCKPSPFFETFQDKQQAARATCQNTGLRGPAVATSFAHPFQVKEKQGSQLPQRSGVSQPSFQKHSAPDGVSPNYPRKFVAQDHQTSACLAAASKDVAQHAHPSPPVTRISGNAGGLQNSSGKASLKHPSLKKLRSWLLQLPSLNGGYDLSLIKRDFQEATGMVLDPPSLGYPKVKDILKEFSKDFFMESPRSGLWLLFRNSKGMPAAKAIADKNTHHLLRESSVQAMKSKADGDTHHLVRGSHGQVGEEVSSEPTQRCAGNEESGLQWKEQDPPSAGVGEVEKLIMEESVLL